MSNLMVVTTHFRRKAPPPPLGAAVGSGQSSS